jgi:hypothetical protein
MALDRELVAYHEAGHAVAAHYLSFPVTRISINREDDDAGHIEYEYGYRMSEVLNESLDDESVEEESPKDEDLDYEDAKARRQTVLERIAMVSLAGAAAQRRFRTNSVTEEHLEGDRHSTGKALLALVGSDDPELWGAWEKVLVVRTERLIERLWSRVEWVATVLLQRTTLEDKDEIIQTILDGDLSLEFRGRKLSPSERLALSLMQMAKTPSH